MTASNDVTLVVEDEDVTEDEMTVFIVRKTVQQIIDLLMKMLMKKDYKNKNLTMIHTTMVV